MSDDPFAGREARERVAVAEHRGREGREGEESDRDRSEAKPGKAALSALVTRGADKRQGERHRPSLPKPQ
jgi:hypothetical protein